MTLDCLCLARNSKDISPYRKKRDEFDQNCYFIQMEWIRSDGPRLPKLTGHQIVRACVYETLTCTKKALSVVRRKKKQSFCLTWTWIASGCEFDSVKCFVHYQHQIFSTMNRFKFWPTGYVSPKDHHYQRNQISEFAEIQFSRHM